jgi:hypothetical protein
VPAETSWQLRAYDATSLELIGTLVVRHLLGTPASLIRCGGERLAFRTTGGQIFVIRLPWPSSLNLESLNRTRQNLPSLALISLCAFSHKSFGGFRGRNLLVNPIPALTELLAFAATQGTVTASNASVFWKLGSLPGAGSASLSIHVRPTNSAPQIVTNQAALVF